MQTILDSAQYKSAPKEKKGAHINYYGAFGHKDPQTEIRKYYEEQEEKALAAGEVEEVFVEEWRCEICKKTFKKEKVYEQHLNSKKHKDEEKKLRAFVSVDDETEAQLAAQ